MQQCAQNNSTVAWVVLCCCRVHATKRCKLCKFFAQLLQCASCTFQPGALHIQLAACVAHVPMLKTCNSHLSHKWYKMTTGSDPRHIKLGKKGQQGHDARTKSCPHYYYFNNFIVIILFLCIRQLQLTNMIFLLRWCGFWPNTNINILVRDCITVGSTTNMAVY